MPINEQDNQYYDEMSFFLVKKSFVYEKNCVLFSIYSNIKRNNFSTESIDILQKNKNTTINIYNAQESDGILSICMFKEEGETENTQTQNNEDNNNNENMANQNQEEIDNNNNVNNNNINTENNNNNENTETEEKEENNELNNNESEIKENFDHIMNLTLIINSEELLNSNYQDKGKTMNGLERY